VEDLPDFTFSDVTPLGWSGFSVTRDLGQEATPDRKPLARRWLPRQSTPDPSWVARDENSGHE
jgi:hypothetical protein